MTEKQFTKILNGWRKRVVKKGSLSKLTLEAYLDNCETNMMLIDWYKGLEVKTNG